MVPRDAVPGPGAAAVEEVAEDHLDDPPLPVDHAPAHGRQNR
jgi:hypothetical protein